MIKRSFLSLGGKVKEEHISQLINAGLLSSSRFTNLLIRICIGFQFQTLAQCSKVSHRVLKIFNANISKKGRKNPFWDIIKSPKQPDSKQCGFYVMRYMKDIVEACKSSEFISLHSVFAGGSYSKTELDEVRTEWAECLQDYVD